MDEGLQALQAAIQALNEAIQLIPDPALVNTLTTCQSNMAAVQQKLMQPQGGGGPREALVGQLGAQQPGY